MLNSTRTVLVETLHSACSRIVLVNAVCAVTIDGNSCCKLGVSQSLEIPDFQIVNYKTQLEESWPSEFSGWPNVYTKSIMRDRVVRLTGSVSICSDFMCVCVCSARHG